MNKSIAVQKFWIFSSYFSVGFTENNLLLSLTACVDLWASETFLTNRKWTGNAPIRNSTSTKWLSWRTSFTSNPSEQYRKSLQVCIYLIHGTFNYSYDDLTNFLHYRYEAIPERKSRTSSTSMSSSSSGTLFSKVMPNFCRPHPVSIHKIQHQLPWKPIFFDKFKLFLYFLKVI